MPEEELIKTYEIDKDGKKIKAVSAEDVLNLMLYIENQMTAFDFVNQEQQLTLVLQGWKAIKTELSSKLEKNK